MTPDQDRQRDELLAVRCQLGEAAAFDELIERWHGPLWAYVRRLSGAEDAADVVQDVWLRVIRGIARLRDGSKLRSWLFTVARTAAMDRLRDKYGRAVEAVDVELHNVAAEPVAEDVEADMVALDRAVEELPVVEREVLTLFYLNELSLTEVAEALKVPVGTVKSRLFRARGMLRLSMQTGESR